MTRPTTKPVATRKRGTTTYQLFANGELWTTGPHGFLCGHVADTLGVKMDYAIDNHEEEMRCLMADAAVEFGW